MGAEQEGQVGQRRCCRIEFPHDYPGAPGHNPTDPGDCFTSNCRYGCGCWAGAFRSGGPDDVDPFGGCPNHPNRPTQPTKESV